MQLSLSNELHELCIGLNWNSVSQQNGIALICDANQLSIFTGIYLSSIFYIYYLHIFSYFIWPLLSKKKSSFWKENQNQIPLLFFPCATKHQELCRTENMYSWNLDNLESFKSLNIPQCLMLLPSGHRKGLG